MLFLSSQHKPSARLLAYALCLVILLPSLSIGAYLVQQMHTRELNSLHQRAESRAALAATFFDEQMSSLLVNLKELAGTPASAPENARDRLLASLDRHGILVLARGTNLDPLAPTNSYDTAIINLDAAMRTAATAALSTFAPQITTYGAADRGGIDIWIAYAEKNAAAPVLLQARVPSVYLAAAFKNFISDGPWSITVKGSNGQTYAEAFGKSLAAHHTEVSTAPFIEALADTSQFGWKIAAALPDGTINQQARCNWMTFVAISSLLAIASFTGATLLTRSLSDQKQPNNRPQASAMSSSTDSRRTIQKFAPPGASGEERMRSALNAGDVGVWEWDLKTGHIHWDAEIGRIFDHLPDSGDQRARDFLRHVEPADRRQLLEAITTVSTKPMAVEMRVRRSDSEIRWIAIRGAVTRREDGRAQVLSGVAYDITDQKLSLSRTDALLREVSHRSKNLLALILAMARLTARDAEDVKSHLKDFTLRVAGLSASQDLIVASDWKWVDLSALALAEVSAVARTDADRVIISGPPVLLTPEAAQTFGMVLTELALNAVQHGALSSATGQVRLTWILPGSNAISISWREIGGPPFAVDGLKGYGRSVLERFSTQGLKLSARAEVEPDGFKWTLSGDLSNIGIRPPAKSSKSV